MSSLNKEALIFAKETAKLVQSFTEFANEKSDDTSEVINEFTKHLDNITDQNKRNNIVQLLEQAQQEIQNVRGSEKSGSQGSDPPDKSNKREELIALLKAGEYTKEQLAEKFGVKVDTIRKRINNLKKAGYQIEVEENMVKLQ